MTDSNFANTGLSADILATLTQRGFNVPTPIQSAAIPVALTGKDVMGIAQTGTGKTLAFGLPILQRLRTESGIALILAPTRELALQIDAALAKVATSFAMRTAVLIGGAPMSKQISQLRAKPRIIVATPGRLLDHLQQHTLRLRDVKILVLDEADRMLDMGFLPAVRQILTTVPVERQTLLFSATMPDEIVRLSDQFMRSPERIEIQGAGSTADLVEQELHIVHHEGKNSHLEGLLRGHKGTTLVFARTRHGARKVARAVQQMGFRAAELHSDRTLAQRRAALEGFRRGEYQVLVATDIAARGIDVKSIGLVVNYDLPDNPEDYVHRIGRTGRAGETGLAITIATPEQESDVRAIERVIRRNFSISPRSPLERRKAEVAAVGVRRGARPRRRPFQATVPGPRPARLRA